MNNRIKKYFNKIKPYFTRRNTGIVLGVVFSFIAYKKILKSYESSLPKYLSLRDFLLLFENNKITEVIIKHFLIFNF